MREVLWHEMDWLHEPPSVVVDAEGMEVQTDPETDFWRLTSYGFVRDDGHLLAMPMEPEAAIEVDFRAVFESRFDQAGLMLRAGPETWLKAGLELSDGRLFASVVVTNGHSDWSVVELDPDAANMTHTVRASRSGDAVTVRHRAGEETEWRLLRVAYLSPDAELLAGPMCCSPTRAGLSVRFVSVRMGPPDARLHEDEPAS